MIKLPLLLTLFAMTVSAQNDPGLTECWKFDGPLPSGRALIESTDLNVIGPGQGNSRCWVLTDIAPVEYKDPNWNRKPEACDSKTYVWRGGVLECVLIDRVQTCRVQRDHNFQALKACFENGKQTESRNNLDAVYRFNAERCRQDGKEFDPTTIACLGALPSGDNGGSKP